MTGTQDAAPGVTLVAYRRIHEYGIVGDMNSCALVSIDGSIDWACFPRFDSPSVFAAILDDTRGGRFSLAPTAVHTSTQRYLPETTVLQTAFSTGSGTVSVTDFMTIAEPDSVTSPHEIVRIVRGLSGTVQMRLVFQPRFDYARGRTTIEPDDHGLIARKGDATLALIAEIPIMLGNGADGADQGVATFEVHEGETVHLVAAYGLDPPPGVGSMDCEAKLERAKRFGEATVQKITYEGRWRDEVVRSFLTLHLLTYEPTGAIVAAATTSLPEHIGGQRNWDYRYSWLRDSAWVVEVLLRLGDPDEGRAFIDWVVTRCWLGIESMQVLYGIDSDSVLEESTLDHLEGHRRSAPVRIGNGAAFHRQLDVFGEVAISLAAFRRFQGGLPEGAWELLARVADLAADTWHLPDRGIWEVRGEPRHFVYSKLMCWVALDRAADLVEAHGYKGDVQRWRKEAAAVHSNILTNGWSDEKQSFIQSYGGHAVDASALLMPFVGFLPIDDPRLRSTVRRVQRELADGPFVRRYLPSETDDGFGEEEGAFYMLSFWLIGSLMAMGEVQEAAALFDDVLATGNHLGLFAEMIDPATGDELGNFPQAFSHIGLIHTARNLSDALDKRLPAHEMLG